MGLMKPDRTFPEVLRVFLRVVSVLCLFLVFSWGYDDESAHPAINECAWRIWWEEVRTSKTPVDMSTYDLDRDRWNLLRKLKGRTVTYAGRWHADMREGDREQNLVEWIMDGGRTADAPHWFQSLRHFYDPTKPEGERYLTDIPEMAKLFNLMESKIRSTDDLALENPRMDARHWALNGSSVAAGTPDNPYAWPRGVEAMQQAFLERDPDKKQRLFALAWRVLGETLHLAADMTLPAHVRDDAHPQPDWVTVFNLRGDPYENGIFEPHVMRVFNDLPRGPMGGLALDDHVDYDLARRIRRAEPYELFHAVAEYVNKNFFSADTVSGRIGGEVISPVNGRLYASPKLEDCLYEQHGNLGGYYRLIPVGAKGGRKVMLLRETMEKATLVDYLRGQWHNRRTLDTIEDCLMDQARILLPIAFMGGARLIDLYVPRIEVKLTEYRPGDKSLRGEVRHHPYGAHAKPLVFNAAEEDRGLFDLYVNKRLQARTSYEMQVSEGTIIGKLNNVTINDGDEIELVVHVGGLPVRSPLLKIMPTQVLLVMSGDNVWKRIECSDIVELRKTDSRTYGEKQARGYVMGDRVEGREDEMRRYWMGLPHGRYTLYGRDVFSPGPPQFSWIAEEGAYEAGKKHGVWKRYNVGPEGQVYLRREMPYINNVKHGLEKGFFSDGRPYSLVNYAEDQLHGESIHYDYRIPGDVSSRWRYENGKQVGDGFEWRGKPMRRISRETGEVLEEYLEWEKWEIEGGKTTIKFYDRNFKLQRVVEH